METTECMLAILDDQIDFSRFSVGIFWYYNLSADKVQHILASEQFATSSGYAEGGRYSAMNS